MFLSFQDEDYCLYLWSCRQENKRKYFFLTLWGVLLIERAKSKEVNQIFSKKLLEMSPPPSVMLRLQCRWSHFAARLPRCSFLPSEDMSRSWAEPRQLSCSASLAAAPSPSAAAGGLEVSSRLAGFAAESSWGRRHTTGTVRKRTWSWWHSRSFLRGRLGGWENCRVTCSLKCDHESRLERLERTQQTR